MGISLEQALDCFASDDLIGIGMEADAVRRRLHPDGVVSYLIDREIDVASGDLYETIAETMEDGGTGVTLRCGADSGFELPWFEQMFHGIKQRFPAIWLNGLSASSVLELAHQAGIPVGQTILRLCDAGLDSIPGHDFGECAMEDWSNVHRTAHRLGMKTTAALTFGAGETIPQRMTYLEALRQLQEETGGFTAFIPFCYKTVSPFDEATAVECLKTLAISRMYLDNIEHIQASGTQGLKVLQMGLRFGGNDVGSVALGKTSGAATEEELRRIIRDAGFRPVQRDTLYRTMFLN